MGSTHTTNKKREKIRGLISKATNGFAPYYRPAVQETVQKYGWQGLDWFIGYLGLGLGTIPPETVEHVATYNNHADGLDAYFSGSVERDIVEKKDGGYVLTDKGRESITHFFTGAYALLADYDWLPEDDMQTLAGLMQKLIESIEANNPLENQTFFRTSRVTDPGPDAPFAPRIDQYLTDLGRLRDDAHIAAWKATELTGPQMETLTFIWQGEHTTAAAIHEQRPNRGYDVDAYQAIIDALAEKGLVEAAGDGYAVTDKGRDLRERIEAETNANYYAGWDALSDDELVRLYELLTALIKHQKDNVPAAEEA